MTLAASTMASCGDIRTRGSSSIIRQCRQNLRRGLYVSYVTCSVVAAMSRRKGDLAEPSSNARAQQYNQRCGNLNGSVHPLFPPLHVLGAALYHAHAVFRPFIPSFSRVAAGNRWTRLRGRSLRLEEWFSSTCRAGRAFIRRPAALEVRRAQMWGLTSAVERSLVEASGGPTPAARASCRRFRAGSGWEPQISFTTRTELRRLHSQHFQSHIVTKTRGDVGISEHCPCDGDEKLFFALSRKLCVNRGETGSGARRCSHRAG